MISLLAESGFTELSVVYRGESGVTVLKAPALLTKTQRNLSWSINSEITKLFHQWRERNYHFTQLNKTVFECYIVWEHSFGLRPWTNKCSSEESSYLQTHQRNNWLPQEPPPSHSELPPHTYSSLPALIRMCRRSHDFPPKHIHKWHGHCKNWGIFLVYVLHLSDCLYIYFYYCVFVLKSCSRKPYLQSEIHTDGSVHAL